MTNTKQQEQGLSTVVERTPGNRGGVAELALIDEKELHFQLDDNRGIQRHFVMKEIGPNQRASDEERARQESAAEQEKARQESAARQEEARQAASAKIEEARQRTNYKQQAQVQRTLRFLIGAVVSVLILFVTAFLLWLASSNKWPNEAMYVIGSLGGLSVIGGGLLTARQAKPEPDEPKTE